MKTVATTTPIHLAYPTLRRAAQILGVDPTRLSRRRPDAVQVGSQKRLAPRTVMAEAVHFNRRELPEVAGELEEVAEQQAPEHREAIEGEIETFLRERRTARPTARPDEDWLEEARRFLPDRIFRDVKDAYERGERPRSISGLPPDQD